MIDHLPYLKRPPVVVIEEGEEPLIVVWVQVRERDPLKALHASLEERFSHRSPSPTRARVKERRLTLTTQEEARVPLTHRERREGGRRRGLKLHQRDHEEAQERD